MAAELAPCPYCGRRMGRTALREHVPTTCRHAPADACIAYTADEARASTEDDYRKLAERVGRATGWLVCHIERGQFKEGRWLTPATPGFPDSWFVHAEAGRLLVVEFKAEKGRTSPKLAAAQQQWLEAVSAVPGALAIRSIPSRWPMLQQALTTPAPPLLVSPT